MVYLPLFSARRSVEKRKAGGSHGGGSSSDHSGSTGGSSGTSDGTDSTSSGGVSSGSGGSDGTTTTPPLASHAFDFSSGGTSRTTSLYGPGDPIVSTIPAGQQFAGREIGGGTRVEIYGTSYHGSGYPKSYIKSGSSSKKYISGRGFPFHFWPVVWGSTVGSGASWIWESLTEFGPPSTAERPGGREVQLQIDSPPPTTTYHYIGDRNTVNALIPLLTSACGTIANKPLTAVEFDGADDQPQPEQAIQYYRASSIVLTMKGYNNSAVFSEDESVAPSPLPSGYDASFLACINGTIGAAVPLVDVTNLATTNNPASTPLPDAAILPHTNALMMLGALMVVGLRNML